MGQTHHTLDRLKEMVGSRPLLSLRDGPELLRLPGADRSYLMRRYWRGYRNRLPFLGGSPARRRYRSFESDLSRLSMRLAGRVRIHLGDGRMLVDECRIPPGFAGDPTREERMREKFRREAGAVLGPCAEAMLGTLERVTGKDRLAEVYSPLQRGTPRVGTPSGSSTPPEPGE
jgi:hypothetical protein